jgi:Mg-chelatase subunit ChlD
MNFLHLTSLAQVHPKRRRGNAMILGLVVWGTLTAALVALALDSGKLIYARSALRDAVDAAAIAAAQAHAEGGNARLAAEESASHNSTKSNFIDPKKLVVQAGNWNFTTRVFTPNGSPSNAVAVDTTQNYKSYSMGKPVDGNDSDESKLKAASIAAFQRRDVVLVLDVSGSMNKQDKISAMKRAVKTFNRLVNDTGNGRDRVAVLTYSDTANWLATFTTSLLGLDWLVDGINANGATNIGDGLKMAIDSLQSEGRSSADQQILLLTDGLANRPEGVDAGQYVRDQAARAKSLSIPIFTISFGDDADRTLMAEVANTTGSKTFHVDSTNESGLIDAFREVATTRSVTIVR